MLRCFINKPDGVAKRTEMACLRQPESAVLLLKEMVLPDRRAEDLD